MVVDDHRGVGPRAVQLGVEEDGGRHVPRALDDVPSASSRSTSDARTSCHHRPHGLHHIPPSAVAQVRWPGEVLGPSLAGEDPQRARQLLLRRELPPDPRPRRRFPHVCQRYRHDGLGDRGGGRAGLDGGERAARPGRGGPCLRAPARRARRRGDRRLGRPGVARPRVRGRIARVPRVVADARPGAARDERDRRGRARRAPADREGVEHPDRGTGGGTPRQPPRRSSAGSPRHRSRRRCSSRRSSRASSTSSAS